MSYYYELRWPLSKSDNKRNCIHMNEKELVNDALVRLDDYLIDLALDLDDEEEAKLLEGYRTILQNKKASFEKIKLPILYDLYAYNDEELDRYTDPKKLHKEQNLCL